MLDRRQFLQVTAATAALSGGGMGSISRLAAAQRISQDDLLAFTPVGQVTLLNFTDCHAQLVPLFYREPSVNLGVGAAKGRPPHITGRELLTHFGLSSGSPAAYAFSSEDFTALARSYGRIGGMDRMATLIKAIRAERSGRTLLLDGGDTWQGSYAALKTRGADMVEVMNAMGVEAMTAHWEFTYGAERVEELIDQLNFPFLAGNVRDTEWEEDVFDATKTFERGGVKITVIGQAFPYTPVANPRYLIPNWSFGIREQRVAERVQQVRDGGADLVVLLSHNGFDVDMKLAARVKGIDVLFSGHTHDAVPEIIKIGDTLMVASGSHGKFLARLDLDVKGGRVVDYGFRLIPVFADAITPDPEIANLIAKTRAPYAKELKTVLGKTDGLLYRRGNVNGTFDDLICDALLERRDAEIALSPGFRWGSSLLPGQDITVEDVYSQTAITYPNVTRNNLTGAFLKEVLEDVADNLFNPDPYYQQGGDMVRVGGMSYHMDINQPIGRRISRMTLLKSGERIEASKEYAVAGWASINPDAEGPAIYDLVTDYIAAKKRIPAGGHNNVTVAG